MSSPTPTVRFGSDKILGTASANYNRTRGPRSGGPGQQNFSGYFKGHRNPSGNSNMAALTAQFRGMTLGQRKSRKNRKARKTRKVRK